MINSKRVIDFFMDIVKVPSPTLLESRFVKYMYDILVSTADNVIIDKKNHGSNLIAHFDGEPGADGIVLCAHMDTVEDGIKLIHPEMDGNMIWAKDGTILGADNKASIAIFLEALWSAREQKKRIRNVDLLLTYGEESHLAGSRELDYNLLRSKKVLLMDSSGKPGGIVISSPTHYSFNITVSGKKAHAGIEPENGTSAIKIAASIIDKLPQGRLDEFTTFNTGSIKGGEASNIVPDRVVISGEFRSLKTDKIEQIVSELQKIPLEIHGVRLDLSQDYAGYEIDQTKPFVGEIQACMKKAGIEPFFLRSGGGSDANIIMDKGFQVLNLNSGMMKPHSFEEYIEIDSLIRCSELVYHLITLEG